MESNNQIEMKTMKWTRDKGLIILRFLLIWVGLVKAQAQYSSSSLIGPKYIIQMGFGSLVRVF